MQSLVGIHLPRSFQRNHALQTIPVRWQINFYDGGYRSKLQKSTTQGENRYIYPKYSAMPCEFTEIPAELGPVANKGL